MLSLSPRYDLFKFALPKEFLPKELEEKYAKIINKDPAVLFTPIDYLNESIQAVSIPGISEINITQTQHGKNSFDIINKDNKTNVEPKHDITYTSSSNPLDLIENSFKVTFRMNQGLYNYFMMYETAFYAICKPLSYPSMDVVKLEILNEDGTIISKVEFYDVHIDGIDGLDFDFSKAEREAGTFDVTFKFNNINFDFV